MKPQLRLGLVLVIFGASLLLYAGIDYTLRARQLKTGLPTEEPPQGETLPIPAMIGVVCLGTGIFVTVLGTGRR